MRRAMAVCFWVCLTCAVAGALVGILRVWGLATEYEVREVWQTIMIVFLAAALTLVTGRVYPGRGQSAEPPGARQPGCR